MIHALDIGSTTIKHASFSNGRKIKEDGIPFPQPCVNSQKKYEVRIGALIKVMEELLSEVKSGDSIVICVQMHGYLLLDNERNPITEYISWRDTRSGNIVEEKRYPFDLPATCGVSKKENLPLAGMCMMKEYMPEVYNKAREFATLGSYIALYLTGCNKSHITDLAPSGMYDCAKKRELSQLKGIKIPDVVTEFDAIGTWNGATVYCPVGDQQAAVFGSSIQMDEYLLNIGTATQICVLSDEFVMGNFESRPYFDKKTLCTVTGLVGGREYSKLCTDETEAIATLTENYGNAIRKLPKRQKIRVVGGTIHYYGKVIEQVLLNLGIPYIISNDTDTLCGLNLLYQMNSKERQDGR